MGKCKRRLLPENRVCKLDTSDQKPEYLEALVLAIMPPDRHIMDLKKIGELSYLKALPCGYQDPILPFSKFIDDWSEKGDMR